MFNFDGQLSKKVLILTAPHHQLITQFKGAFGKSRDSETARPPFNHHIEDQTSTR